MMPKIHSDGGQWWLDALCRGLDGNIWFPEKPQGRDYFALARSYCVRCPVRIPCLEEALSVDPEYDRFGMYGGLSPKERSRLREGKSPQAAQSPIVEIKPEAPRIEPKPAPRILPAVSKQLPDLERKREVVRAYMDRNKPDWVELALRKKATRLVNKDIPKATRLVMEVTPTMGASMLTAQASAAMIMAGWEDPINPRTAAALFMGASYVGELARRGVESEVITPQENAAIQGVVELAMQVWKYHALHAKMDASPLVENHDKEAG